jgi:hypothetical protein
MDLSSLPTALMGVTQKLCKVPSGHARIRDLCVWQAMSCVSHLHFPAAGWAVPSGFMKYNSITGEYAGDVRTSMA